MPVIKGKYSLNFTSIPNSTLQDTSISFEAKGVLALMLSMPSDWSMYKSWLVDQCSNTGKDKMTRILKELEASNYLVRVKKRNNAGQFDSYDWFVYPEPYAENESTGNGSAGAGSAVNGKSAPTKDTDIQKKQCTKTDDLEEIIRYEQIMDLYNQILGDSIGKIRAVTGQRKKHIRARVKEDQKRQSTEWWQNYFLAVQQMPFLIGQGAPNPATGKPWSADFDWLINETNMIKVLEGKYGQ